jgi:alpha-L-fucosidase
MNHLINARHQEKSAMKRFLSVVLLFVLPAAYTASAGGPAVEPNWESIDRRPTPDWFQDSKFGIFIHWGVYSVPSFAPTEGVSVYARYAEWYWNRLANPQQEGHDAFKAFHDRVFGPQFQYPDFAGQFKAEMFNPEAWADVFKRSGARYIVLTGKHHDGFCLWPSAQSWNWNAVDVGPHRDLAGDLSKAVRSRGIHMGFYYSLYEWFNPLYHADVDRYVAEHMIPQIKDLVLRYEPDLLFTDGEWDHPSERWRAPEFLAWLFNESPVRDRVAVNDRWGKETRGVHGGYFTTEYGLVHDKAASAETRPHPWEECRGIGNSFGYNRAETLKDYSSPTRLIHLLIDCVSRGGNLLLDIGPTADGRIPVIMEERLLQMGEWLELNGEAIYGTRPWKAFSDSDSIRYTAKGDTVYAICLKRPGTRLVLNAPKPDKQTSVVLSSTGAALKWKTADGGMQIEIPAATLLELAPSPATVIRLVHVR